MHDGAVRGLRRSFEGLTHGTRQRTVPAYIQNSVARDACRSAPAARLSSALHADHAARQARTCTRRGAMSAAHSGRRQRAQRVAKPTHPRCRSSWTSCPACPAGSGRPCQSRPAARAPRPRGRRWSWRRTAGSDEGGRMQARSAQRSTGLDARTAEERTWTSEIVNSAVPARMRATVHRQPLRHARRQGARRAVCGRRDVAQVARVALHVRGRAVRLARRVEVRACASAQQARQALSRNLRSLLGAPVDMQPLVVSPNSWMWKPCRPAARPVILPLTVVGPAQRGH